MAYMKRPRWRESNDIENATSHCETFKLE